MYKDIINEIKTIRQKNQYLRWARVSVNREEEGAYGRVLQLCLNSSLSRDLPTLASDWLTYVFDFASSTAAHISQKLNGKVQVKIMMNMERLNYYHQNPIIVDATQDMHARTVMNQMDRVICPFRFVRGINNLKTEIHRKKCHISEIDKAVPLKLLESNCSKWKIAEDENTVGHEEELHMIMYILRLHLLLLISKMYTSCYDTTVILMQMNLMILLFLTVLFILVALLFTMVLILFICLKNFIEPSEESGFRICYRAVTFKEKNRLCFTPKDSIQDDIELPSAVKTDTEDNIKAVHSKYSVERVELCVKPFNTSVLTRNLKLSSRLSGKTCLKFVLLSAREMHSKQKIHLQTRESLLRNILNAEIVHTDPDLKPVISISPVPEIVHKKDSDDDNANEQREERGEADGFTVLQRLNYLFRTSNALSWRVQPDIQVFYVIKSPNPLMESTFCRLASFATWPENAPQIFSTYLVDAGFYFDPDTQSILCFYCGLSINYSELGHHTSRCSLIQMHLLFSESCAYALQQKHKIEGLDTADGQQPAGQTQTDHSSPVRSGVNSNNSVTSDLQSNRPLEQPLPIGRPFIGAQSAIDSVRPMNTEQPAASCPFSSFQPSTMPALSNTQHNTVQDSPQVATVQSISPPCSDTYDNTKSMLCASAQSGSTDNLAKKLGAMACVDRPIVSLYDFDLKHPQLQETKQRIESFQRPNTPHVLILKMSEIVLAGFFFTGERDIVRCFCCDIGLAEWMEEDNVWEEHAKHAPACQFLKLEKGEAYINHVQEEWCKIYRPKHPGFVNYTTRLLSFVGFPSTVTQSTSEIAAAGFFYTGEGDVVRCHYCDGGLREWEPGDEPWVEHAKWFPFCKYLMKVKGREYVERINAEMVAAQADDTEEVSPNHMQNSNPTPSGNTDPSSASAITATTRNTNEVMNVLHHLGYNMFTIQRAIQVFLQQEESRPYTADDIMNIILDMQERDGHLPAASGNSGHIEQGAGDTPSKQEIPANSITSQGLIEEKSEESAEKDRKQLLNQIMCLKCKSSERRILFIPCGHRLFCEPCSKGISACPSCGRKVKKKTKTFLS